MKLKKPTKEIVWGFAQDLSYQGYEVMLSNYKEQGCYTLVVDGEEHQPKTKREVYRILREVDLKFTAWWEQCNAHFYIQHEQFQEAYLRELFEAYKAYGNHPKCASFLAANSGDQFGETDLSDLIKSYLEGVEKVEQNWEDFAGQVTPLILDRNDAQSDFELFHSLAQGYLATNHAGAFVWYEEPVTQNQS